MRADKAAAQKNKNNKKKKKKNEDDDEEQLGRTRNTCPSLFFSSLL